MSSTFPQTCFCYVIFEETGWVFFFLICFDVHHPKFKGEDEIHVWHDFCLIQWQETIETYEQKCAWPTKKEIPTGFFCFAFFT